MSTITRFFQGFFNALIPRRCQICDQVKPNHWGSICENCLPYLPVNQNYCYQCAKSLPRIALCGNCLKQPRYFDITIAPYLYQNQIAKLIIEAKFNKNISATKALSDLLIHYLKNHYLPERKPEAIIYVPSHSFKLRMRGFNLAYFLAKDLQKSLNLPLFHLIKKTKNRPTQSSLNRKQRLTNLVNAFKINDKVLRKINQLNYKHLAIVDDVMTTCATANEIAKLIKSKTKIKQIDVWLVARAD